MSVPPPGAASAIRRATPGDRDELLRLRSLLWPLPPAELEPEVDRLLAAPPGQAACLVADHPAGGGLAGFLEVGLRDHADGCQGSPVAYVEAWYVEPAFRGAGLGRALLAACEDWARSLGLAELASDTDLRNELGHRAHLALGFEEVARAILFRKVLGPG